MHGMLLSVLLILSYPDGGQTIEQWTHQFVGPTAIEYCQNAKDRLHAATHDPIISIHASCFAN